MTDLLEPEADTDAAQRTGERRRQGLEAAAVLARVLVPPIALEDALVQVARGLHVLSTGVLAAVVALPRGGDPVVTAVSGRGDLRPGGLLGEMVRVTHAESGDLHVQGHQVLVMPLHAPLPDPAVLVVVAQPEQAPLPYEERELLESYADQAGLALDRVLAAEDRGALVALAARHGLAQELHDVLVQRLFAAGLMLEAMREADPDEVPERVDAVVGVLDDVIAQVRQGVLRLREQ